MDYIRALSRCTACLWAVSNEVRVMRLTEVCLWLGGTSCLSRRRWSFEYFWMTCDRSVRPCYGSFGQSPASQNEGSRSIPGQIVGFVVGKVTLWENFLQILQFSRHYHSTIAPYSFIHLPHTLYKVFLTVLHFSPLSVLFHHCSSLSISSFTDATRC